MNKILRFSATVVLVFAAANQVQAWQNEQQQENESVDSYDNPFESHFAKLCPIEKGWARVEDSFVPLTKSVGIGSFGSITMCRESKKSIWLYFPIVDRPYTKADAEGIRLSVFALNKQSKVAQVKTYKPVRWASNKTPTSLSLFEFQIDPSELKMMPGKIAWPKEMPAEEAATPCVFVFLEKRTAETANNKDESSGKKPQAKKQEAKKQAAEDLDEDKLIQAEANALEQHSDTLWLSAPHPLSNFESRIYTPKRDFIGHVLMRRIGKRLLCTAYAIVKGEPQEFPELIITGPDGKALPNGGGSAAMSGIKHNGKQWAILTVAREYRNLPKFGTVGFADGRGK